MQSGDKAEKSSGEDRANTLLDLLIDAMVERLREAKTNPDKPLLPSEVTAMANFCKLNGINISTLDTSRQKKVAKVAGELVPPNAMKLTDMPGFSPIRG